MTRTVQLVIGWTFLGDFLNLRYFQGDLRFTYIGFSLIIEVLSAYLMYYIARRIKEIYIDWFRVRFLIIFCIVVSLVLYVTNETVNADVSFTRQSLLHRIFFYLSFATSYLLTCLKIEDLGKKRRYLVYVALVAFSTTGSRGAALAPLLPFILSSLSRNNNLRTRLLGYVKLLSLPVFYLLVRGIPENISSLQEFFERVSSFDGFIFTAAKLQFGGQPHLAFTDLDKGFGVGVNMLYYLASWSSFAVPFIFALLILLYVSMLKLVLKRVYLAGFVLGSIIPWYHPQLFLSRLAPALMLLIILWSVNQVKRSIVNVTY